MTISEIIADPLMNYPQATVAAFDPTEGDLPRRRLDEHRNRLFLEALARAGVPAVLIGASTGHGHVRTPEELLAWIQSAARANWMATVKMALLRPEDGAANGKLVDGCAKSGYSVVFVRPGRDLPPQASDAAVAENMMPLVEMSAKAGMAVGIYSIPDVSGVPLTVEAAKRLLQSRYGDSIVAAKITEANYESSTLAYLRCPELGRLKIVQGWDPFLARALQDGPQHDLKARQRCGVTSGPMSFAVFQYRHLLEEAAKENWEEVQSAQSAVTSLFVAMQDDPKKFADLQRAKFVMGLGQPLLGTVSTAQIERLLQALRGIPREADRSRLARSLNLLDDGPFAVELRAMS